MELSIYAPCQRKENVSYAPRTRLSDADIGGVVWFTHVEQVQQGLKVVEPHTVNGLIPSIATQRDRISATSREICQRDSTARVRDRRRLGKVGNPARKCANNAR